MRKKTLRFKIVFIAGFGCLLSLGFTGCNLIPKGEDPGYQEVIVTLSGILPAPPTSMSDMDQISVYNQTSCTEDEPDEQYFLEWNGNSFSSSHIMNCSDDGDVTITYEFDIEGELSSNHQTLKSFIGTRKVTYVSGDYHDYMEFAVELKDVPLDGDAELLSGYETSNLRNYIVNASWLWRTTEDGETNQKEGTVEEFDHGRMSLNVLFYGGVSESFLSPNNR